MHHFPNCTPVRVFGEHTFGPSCKGTQETLVQTFERVLDDTGDVADITSRDLCLHAHGSCKSKFHGRSTISDQAEQESSTSLSYILVPFFRSAALFLSIPSLVVSTPSLRFPPFLYRYRYVNPSKLFTVFCVVSLSLVSSSVACIIRDTTLVLACSGTFLLPGMSLHALHHMLESESALC